jgi:hypothetical protein
MGLQKEGFLLLFICSLTKRNGGNMSRKKKILFISWSFIYSFLVLFLVSQLKDSLPDYQQLLEPVSHGSISYGVLSSSGFERLFELLNEDNKITEKTLKELSEINLSQPNYHSSVYFVPIRAFPIWGTDIRVEYFLEDTNCDSKINNCEVFHSSHNFHFFSKYRFDPNPLNQEWLTPDNADYSLSYITAFGVCCYFVFSALIKRVL